jgi:hypothetical protein
MLLGELDRRTYECRSDASLAEPGARDKAGHRPNARVSLVFVSALPGNTAVTEQSCVPIARFDSAPAHRLAAEIRDQAARRVSLGMTAAGLLSEPDGKLISPH